MFENECCHEVAYKKIKNDCDDCGKGLRREDVTMSLIGNDIVALYPSLTARNTAKKQKHRKIRIEV